MRTRMLAVGVLALSVGGVLTAALALAAPGAIKVLSYNGIPNNGGFIPSYSAAGPAPADVLVGGNDFTGSSNVIKAINASTGQPDPNVASGGYLPLPPAYPAQRGSLDDIEFFDNAIYGAFFEGTAIYLASWNANGQPNHGFGSDGLATIPSPSSYGFVGIGIHVVLSGGRLLVVAPAGGRISLTPVDPATGTVGATVVEPLPGNGSAFVTSLPAAQIGPDGNLYAVGGTSGGATQAYYGIFDPSTLAVVGQTTFSDAGSTSGAALGFIGNTAYLGVTGGSGGTDLFSAPAGAVSTISGPTAIPVPLSGAQQQLIALIAGPAGLLYVTVVDQTQSSAGSYVLETDGSSFGPALLVSDGQPGDATFARAAAPAPSGNLYVTGFVAAVSAAADGGTFRPDVHTSYKEAVEVVVGTGSFPNYCTPVKLTFEKTLVGGGLKNGVSFDAVALISPLLHEYAAALNPALVARKKIYYFYFIEITNVGHCPAINLKVSDELPHEFAFRAVFANINPKTGQSSLGPVTGPSGPTLGGDVTVSIPVLDVGSTFIMDITGIVAGDQTNTAVLTGPGGIDAQYKVTVLTYREPAAQITDTSAQSIGGTAGGASVKEVEVAIDRQSGAGKASEASLHCVWLKTRRARFKNRACSQPVWLKATGTKRWQLVFGRPLPPGRYVVLVRAIGKHGLSSDTFTRRGRDIAFLTVH